MKSEMRLIDKDSLIKSLYERFVDDEVKICLQEFWHGIEVKECIEAEKEVDAIPISFIEKIIHRDICLVYRGCLLMLLEKWKNEIE